MGRVSHAFNGLAPECRVQVRRGEGLGGRRGDGCDVVCGRALLVDGVVDGHFW